MLYFLASSSFFILDLLDIPKLIAQSRSLAPADPKISEAQWLGCFSNSESSTFLNGLCINYGRSYSGHCFLAYGCQIEPRSAKLFILVTSRPLKSCVCTKLSVSRKIPSFAISALERGRSSIGKRVVGCYYSAWCLRVITANATGSRGMRAFSAKRMLAVVGRLNHIVYNVARSCDVIPAMFSGRCQILQL